MTRRKDRKWLCMLTLVGKDVNGDFLYTHHRDTYTIQGPCTLEKLFEFVLQETMGTSLIVSTPAVVFWYAEPADIDIRDLW